MIRTRVNIQDSGGRGKSRDLLNIFLVLFIAFLVQLKEGVLCVFVAGVSDKKCQDKERVA